MRFDLKVPFAEKDEAKKLGARWDPARKLWYVTDKPDMAPFACWTPTPHEGAAPAKSATRPHTQGSGKVITGSQYTESPRVCTCLPWEDCEACRG